MTPPIKIMTPPTKITVLDLVHKEASKVVYPLIGDTALVVSWLNSLCKRLNKLGFHFIPIPLERQDKIINHCTIAHFVPTTRIKIYFDDIDVKTAQIGINIDSNVVLISLGRGGWECEYSLVYPNCEELVQQYLLDAREMKKKKR